MDENTTYELVTEALEDSLKELKTLEPGSEQHSRQVADICKLHEAKLKEDKMNDDRNESLYRRGFESEKLEQERKMRWAEIKNVGKQIVFTVVKDGGIALLYVLANGRGMTRIMNFETTGTIGSKAFGLLPKLNRVK